MPAHAAVDRDHVERLYLSMLPDIESWSRMLNRGLDADAKEEAVQESRCWSWQWMLSAAGRGRRLAKLSPASLARFAHKMWRCGRRFAGTTPVRDAMSEQALARGDAHRTSIEDLASRATECTSVGRAISQALVDSRHSRPDQVVRVDYDFDLAKHDPHLSDRAVEVFDRLLLDHEYGCNQRIAQELAVSPPRVSQIKKHELSPALTRIGYGLSSETSRVAAA